MMKKAIALAGAGAFLLGAVMPVLAGCQGGRCMRDRTTWDVNVALVENEAEAEADTGDNEQYGTASSFGGDAAASQVILTGNAVAGATAVTVANTDLSCRCRRDPCECKQNHVDFAWVENEAEAEAETGDNEQHGTAMSMDMGGQKPSPCRGRKCGGGSNNSDGSAMLYQETWTGDAVSYADAWTVVNTRVR